MIATNNSQCSNLIQCPITNNLISINSNNSSYLNETNNFCTWNTNCTFDTLASNFEENSKHAFMKQQQQQQQQHMNNSSSRGGPTTGGQNGFVYPQQHFQTVSSNQLLSGDIQVAVPVTALVFSQSSSLPSNLLAQQQQNLISASNTINSNSNNSFINNNTLSNLQAMERQM